MNRPMEMHPRIFERRKAVFMGQLQYVSPEDEEQAVSDFVSHYERKLPLPENYRKKTLSHLRKLLRRIDKDLGLVSKPTWGEVGKGLSAMYGRHRGHVVKELARRMVQRA